MNPSNPASRQLLVAFKRSPPVETRTKLWEKYKLREIEQVAAQSLFLVEAPLNTGAQELKKIQEALGIEPEIRYAEPNIQLRTFKSE